MTIPDFVGVVGGDGTLRCAAEVLLDSGVPFLPVPAGTRNHFAREMGIDSFEAAGRAATTDETRPGLAPLRRQRTLRRGAVRPDGPGLHR